MSDSGTDEDFGMFKEPNDYYKPEPDATCVRHVLRSGEELKLRLVGSNPLWGHLLWNAGRTIAHYLEDHAAECVSDRNVLELGAGAGLPSLTAAIRGASMVVVTDYPDGELIDNLWHNIHHCEYLEHNTNIRAVGYLWGNSVAPLLDLLPRTGRAAGFQTIILADLLFNHSEHQKLLQTIELTLARDEVACALVFFTPYRPWLLEKDLAFFDLAKSAGFTVKQILEKRMEKVMFEEDPGDENLRRTVFGYELRWPLLSASDEGKQ